MNSLPADPATLWTDEPTRRWEFPVCERQVFLAHAAVCALPRRVAEAEADFVRAASEQEPDYAWILDQTRRTREAVAQLLPGAHADEIALLGPTSLALSLVALGLPWESDDEVVYHADCYPANVYPWMELARRGVRPVALQPDRGGEVTPEVVERALTPRTRLVALASANFLSGHRIDLDAIGKMLSSRGVLLCVDAIQTLGAFPLSVEHVDFLAADAHKWMLGPLAVGVFMVKRAHWDRLRPALLGAANVRCPDFIAQDEIVFAEGAARYEPGVLNFAPMLGMKAGLEMIAHVGVQRVGERIHALKRRLLDHLSPLGFTPLGEVDGPRAAGMLTLAHPSADLPALYKALKAAHVIPSLRRDRAGQPYLRFSPHFSNTEAEMDRVAEVVAAHLPTA